MYSYLRSVVESVMQKSNTEELLAMEHNILDEEEQKESDEAKNGLIDKGNTSDEDDDNEASSSRCSKRKGVITQVIAKGGFINNTIPFEKKAALELFSDLHAGCVVEYLSYMTLHGDERVVKIENILEYNWEDQQLNKMQQALDALKLDKPKFFNTQTSKILGVIKRRSPSSIEVETDYGDHSVELDNIELSFIPRQGDAVNLECNVQLDEGYVDKQGEILEVLNVSPARIETNEKCIVERVFEEFCVLDSNGYVLKEDLPNDCELHLGDILKADLIECSYGKYSRRAIKISLLEKNFGQVKKTLENHSASKHAINIEGKDRYVFSEQWKKEKVTLKVRSNCNRDLTLNSIEIKNSDAAQISVVEPLSPRNLTIGGDISIVLEVHTKFIGESKERFVLHFDNFKFARHLTIIVCNSDIEAKESELRLIAAEHMRVFGRTEAQRSRYYANQVWSTKNVLVQGQPTITKSRFLKHRIGSFDVPVALREIVLGTERRRDMDHELTTHYPYLEGPLTIENYVQRFGVLLHLEEINLTVSMRNYDRERAHFCRDGEFLSLHIENLAERRPSLVLGDTVHAINPWANVNSKDTKIYEGFVHKVLHNRILLKFNAGFQDPYNGEDYRLTFHFSRMPFRKQHFAIRQALTQIGEHTLFPKTIIKHENPQLDIQFKDNTMHLYSDQLRWFNKSLNSIQKRAVANILRGEAKNTPYVIFGPPGTGKTVTLVETVLQLVHNLPSSRLLVCAPSNSAADLITKHIIDSKVLPHGEFIRLVGQNQIERGLIPDELIRHCGTADIGIADNRTESMVVTEAGLKLRCQSKFIALRRIIISTCTTMGNFLQMDFPSNHFTHLLIDEAAQCTEPETMVPIMVLKRGQLILAGDPQQLQSVVIDPKAKQYGMQISLLERLLQLEPYRKDKQRFPDFSGYNPCLLTKLLNNYRALPTIMDVYSKLFYDDELISMVSEKDSRELHLLTDLHEIFKPIRDIPYNQGTFFHGIIGENLQEMDSPSWFNPAEAREVFLTTIHLYRRNVKSDQIGIVTPYSKQVKSIRDMFIVADVVMPKIGTAEEFQGQERDIILISTVRSSETIITSDLKFNLGFVQCRRRMNVGISRARALLIVFGNPNLLSLDDNWRKFILYCAHNNAYFGCELPRSVLKNGNDEDDDDTDSDSQSDS
ncbi:probable RNA helicase armi [Drosophila albomicans]|uniref:RNA helicase n=1 Tax=Drosophila albomicans TaxID=7291 RepID=A0A6P8XDF6_DROAB|nr:probable RNA helicase armi [Drosophila albomicans]